MMNLLKRVGIFLLMSLSSYAAVKNFNADLSFRHNDPAGRIDDIQGNKYWVDLDLDYYYHKPFIDREGKIDISFRYNDANALAFSINEAKMTYLYNKAEVTYGVQTLDWVEIDSVWGLAKLNNAENFDYFNPGKAGLPGVRYRYKPTTQVELDLFGSFLYVPQLNPMLNIDARSNSLTSRSPWADVPAPEVQTDGQIDPLKINYVVNMPSIFNLITQFTAGVNLKYSPLDDLHFSSFIIRKPENRIANSVRVQIKNSDLTADITPQVYHHTLYGAQVASTFKEKSIKAYLSFYTSVPTRKESNITNQAETVLSNNNAGLGISLEQYRENYLGLGVKQKKGNLFWELGYIARLNRFEKESVLDQIPRWSAAVNAKIDLKINQNWSTYFDIKYDIVTSDRLYQGALNYNVSRSLAMNAGFEIIGTPISGKGFWVPYRENDSYFAELKLKF